jgi:inorganic pyrophosphatase
MKKLPLADEFNNFAHQEPRNIEERLGEKIKIKIDRPMGSKHPKYGFIYPVNYGHIPGVMGRDGKEIDAYLLGVFEPVKEYEGRLIAVIQRYDDKEEEILVVAPTFYNADQVRALVEFQERWFKSFVAWCYEKPYWPDTFSPSLPEVQRALKVAIKYGKYSTVATQAVIEKSYGYCYALGCWLEDNGIVGKANSSRPRALKVKTYEEAIKKLKGTNN